VRLFHFTTDADAEFFPDQGFTDSTVWLRAGAPGGGVELSDTTRTDAYSADTSWLVVVEIHERHIAPYERGPIGRPILRALLESLGVHAHGREWLVPAQPPERTRSRHRHRKLLGTRVRQPVPLVARAMRRASRLVADRFKLPGQTATWARAAGMADDYVSALTRWVTCVVVGLAFLAGGIIDLAGR
jgi:hypothetical protein